jgi:hypothetical protein
MEIEIVNMIGTKDYSIPSYLANSYKEKKDAMLEVIRIVRPGIALQSDEIESWFQKNIFRPPGTPPACWAGGKL